MPESRPLRPLPLSYRTGPPGEEVPVRIRASATYHLVVYAAVLLMLAGLLMMLIWLMISYAYDGRGEVIPLIGAMLVVGLLAFYFGGQVREQLNRLRRRHIVRARPRH